jgi:SAM-dependent methyltransferase
MTLSFPAARISSQDEFQVWANSERAVLEQQLAAEQSLPEIRQGSCGLCFDTTEFHPDTRCSCAKSFTGHQRAALHFLQSRVGLGRGTQIAMVGADTRISGQLKDWGARIAPLPRLVAGKLPIHDATAELVLCLDYAQHVPPLAVFLRELARIVRSNGVLVITLPFDVNAPATRARPVERPPGVQESAAPIYIFGWDFLDLLRDAGFRDVAAHFYWSAEFGYTGPFDPIISAVRTS